jgi:hypothetical protein
LLLALIVYVYTAVFIVSATVWHWEEILSPPGVVFHLGGDFISSRHLGGDFISSRLLGGDFISSRKRAL